LGDPVEPIIEFEFEISVNANIGAAEEEAETGRSIENVYACLA
jgi:hypothetical protein